MPSRIETLTQQIAELQAELDNLASRPAEPEQIDAIVRFSITRNTGRPGRNPTFTYVAHKTRSEWWVAGPEWVGVENMPLSGPSSSFTWDKLVDWIQANGGSDLDIVDQLSEYGTVTPAEQNGAAPQKAPRARNGRASARERRGSSGKR